MCTSFFFPEINYKLSSFFMLSERLISLHSMVGAGDGGWLLKGTCPANRLLTRVECLMQADVCESLLKEARYKRSKTYIFIMQFYRRR